jgi:chromosome condensin MukBEF MukE localization factor
MFSLIGWAGQHGYNYLDARNSGQLQELAELRARGEDKPRETLMHKIAKSKWSPMQVLSDEDYEKMMQEKLLRVEADIAMVDDKIEALKKQAVEGEAHRQIKHVHEQERISK